METPEAPMELSAPPKTAFYLKPSVCTWLQPRHYVPRDAARRAKAAQAVREVPFHLKPSVGSWLTLRLLPDEPEHKEASADLPPKAAKTVEEPWADFEVFADPGVEAAKLADAVGACATPSTGQSAQFSPLQTFKLAPPPSPAGAVAEEPLSKECTEEVIAVLPQDSGEDKEAAKMTRTRTAVIVPPPPSPEEARDAAPKMARMRSALVDKEGKANSGMSRMRSAVVMEKATEEYEPEDGEPPEVAEKREDGGESEAQGMPRMSKMRTAMIPEAEAESPGTGETAAMEEEVVAPGAGRHGVPLARAGGPPPSSAPPRPPATVILPQPDAPESTPVPPPEPTSMKELDNLVASSLDSFFGDERNWKKVGREIASSAKSPAANRRLSAGSCRFRIQVPKPYPGVQYRRSKCLDDRYPRFAENGSVVQGRIEDNGEWLKVGEQIYLPMRVGAVRIMEPLPSEDGEAPAAAAARGSAADGFWGWLACCSGERSSASMDSEVVVNPDDGGSSQQRSPPLRGSSPPGRSAPNNSGATPGAGATASGARTSGPSAGGGGGPRAGPYPAGGAGLSGLQRSGEEEDSDFQGPKRLPEDISRNPLSNLDAANRHFSAPINPFSDVASTGSASPTKRRTESRLQNETMQSTLPDPIKDVFQA